MILWSKSDMMLDPVDGSRRLPACGRRRGLPSLDARAQSPGLRPNRACEAAGRAPGGLACALPQPRGSPSR